IIADTEVEKNPPPMIRYERSEMAVPLTSKDECIGVIYVGQQKANAFSHDDLNLLSTLANQTSIAVTNAKLYEKTHNMATTDGLTGLYTHRYFQEKLEEEVQKAQRYQTHMAMLMVDTDHFKQYNDTYGHPDGDMLLKEICKLLKSYVRDTDIVCRYGGDEFTLILVEADKKTAINTAERIRQAIQLRLNQRDVKITASIGVASYPEDATNKTALMAQADASVYKAKHGGRNRVCYP
ncbi:MAG: sensor domain-containing diguanylate cyclase, partial [Candidatus Eremiobacterota bacterium]